MTFPQNTTLFCSSLETLVGNSKSVWVVFGLETYPCCSNFCELFMVLNFDGTKKSERVVCE
jgi:hypothetical protein